MAKIRICPKCHSPNLQREATRGMSDIAGIQPTYTCNECDFSGSVFPEVTEEEFKKLKEKNANSNT